MVATCNPCQRLYSSGGREVPRSKRMRASVGRGEGLTSAVRRVPEREEEDLIWSRPSTAALVTLTNAAWL